MEIIVKMGYWYKLEECVDIAETREKQYGSAEDNFKDILRILHAITDKEWTADDIVNVLIALKLGRRKVNPEKEDSDLDLINYIAI